MISKPCSSDRDSIPTGTWWCSTHWGILALFANLDELCVSIGGKCPIIVIGVFECPLPQICLPEMPVSDQPPMFAGSCLRAAGGTRRPSFTSAVSIVLESSD